MTNSSLCVTVELIEAIAESTLSKAMRLIGASCGSTPAKRMTAAQRNARTEKSAAASTRARRAKVDAKRTAAMNSRLYSKRSREVWLKMGKLAWSQIPLALRSRLLEGLERTASVRDQIGAAAAVSSMPPVQVVPELWYDDERCCDGCAGPLIVNGNRVFGCTLPAQTATLEDEELLRRVMVHEFCHCFWWSADEVNAKDAGVTTIDTSGLDQKSDSDDRFQMVDPGDWFGAEDANRMIYQDSPETQRIQDNLSGLIGCLPQRISPPKRFTVKKITLPNDIEAHVRRLRVTRSSHPDDIRPNPVT